jgi:hypothetical protein
MTWANSCNAAVGETYFLKNVLVQITEIATDRFGVERVRQNLNQNWWLRYV